MAINHASHPQASIRDLDTRVDAIETGGGGGGGGSTIITDAGAPSGGTGSVGSFYIDTDTGVMYEKTGASAWTQVINPNNGFFDGGGANAIHATAIGTTIDGGTS